MILQFSNLSKYFELYRSIEEFAEPGVPENVQKMRYDHYMKKAEGKTVIYFKVLYKKSAKKERAS